MAGPPTTALMILIVHVLVIIAVRLYVNASVCI